MCIPKCICVYKKHRISTSNNNIDSIKNTGNASLRRKSLYLFTYRSADRTYVFYFSSQKMLLKKNCGGKTRTIKIRVSGIRFTSSVLKALPYVLNNFLLTMSRFVLRLKNVYRLNNCDLHRKPIGAWIRTCLGILACSRPLQKEAQYAENSDVIVTLCGIVSLQPDQLHKLVYVQT